MNLLPFAISNSFKFIPNFQFQFYFLDLAQQPRPEIASAMSAAAASKRRKPLQLQFSIHEKSDGEDNEEESVFLDNNPEIVTSVVSDEEDEVTTSPSLTFGVVDPRGQRTEYR